MPVYQLTDQLVFPPAELADPDGLLAVGGDLSVERLLLAYRSGIFPWYEPGQPILWWSPDPRLVLFPLRLQISHSMRPVLNSSRFSITYDRHFSEVIHKCATVSRSGQHGTWITAEMEAAYIRLHEAGWAHSAEVWDNGTLVGGLYGVCIGGCFFGESMFTEVPNASKFALIKLVRDWYPRGLALIDCQVPSRHLLSLGAELIPRSRFLRLLPGLLRQKKLQHAWAEQKHHAPSNREG